MALFGKKQKKEDKEDTKESAEIEVPEIEVQPQTTGNASSCQVLKHPHVSEKAGMLADKNQYVFRVFEKSNKVEIKKAVKDLYKVDVVGVKIIKIPAKKRQLGKYEGFKKGYKKAIVILKKGQTIEVAPK